MGLRGTGRQARTRNTTSFKLCRGEEKRKKLWLNFEIGGNCCAFPQTTESSGDTGPTRGKYSAARRRATKCRTAINPQNLFNSKFWSAGAVFKSPISRTLFMTIVLPPTLHSPRQLKLAHLFTSLAIKNHSQCHRKDRLHHSPAAPHPPLRTWSATRSRARKAPVRAKRASTKP